MKKVNKNIFQNIEYINEIHAVQIIVFTALNSSCVGLIEHVKCYHGTIKNSAMFFEPSHTTHTHPKPYIRIIIRHTS